MFPRGSQHLTNPRRISNNQSIHPFWEVMILRVMSRFVLQMSLVSKHQPGLDFDSRPIRRCLDKHGKVSSRNDLMKIHKSTHGFPHEHRTLGILPKQPLSGEDDDNPLGLGQPLLKEAHMNIDTNHITLPWKYLGSSLAIYVT